MYIQGCFEKIHMLNSPLDSLTDTVMLVLGSARLITISAICQPVSGQADETTIVRHKYYYNNINTLRNRPQRRGRLTNANDGKGTCAGAELAIPCIVVEMADGWG